MDDPGAFFDPVAPVYDAKVDGSTGGDVGFYRELAVEADGPVLELGVGTGRIYLELLAAGVEVTGIDLSERMLDQLRANADERGLEPDVRQADMTEFKPGREYALVYAPARAFNHLPTLSDQRAALERVRDALAPDGRFALNTYAPRFEAVAEYGTQEERLEVDGVSYRLVHTSRLADEVEQVVHIDWEVYREGELVADRETPVALVQKRQFELLFDLAGFSDWQVYGGFDHEPLESSDQEMVWVASA